MDLIFEDRKRRTINKEEEINFSSFSSFHLIAVTARAKGERQLSATDDEDLTVEIDGKSFPRLDNQNRLVDSPASFSGGRLHNLAKTDYFLTLTFNPNLSAKTHYLEFEADRRPIPRSISFDFGGNPPIPKTVPTIDNPKWTEDFYDDTAELLLARLILGEAADQSREAKVWVGGCVLNRVAAGAWPDTIHGVILQPDQYDPFKRGDPNFSRIIDPLNDASEVGVVAWKESYEIATGLISGRIKNPTEATHFHGRGVSKDWFLENIVPKGRSIDTIDDTYFYWSPN